MGCFQSHPLQAERGKSQPDWAWHLAHFRLAALRDLVSGCLFKSFVASEQRPVKRARNVLVPPGRNLRS